MSRFPCSHACLGFAVTVAWDINRHLAGFLFLYFSADNPLLLLFLSIPKRSERIVVMKIFDL